MSEVEHAPVPGERGPVVAARTRSLSGWFRQGLAIGVVGLVGGGFLFWYYSGLAERGQVAEAQATAQRTRQAQSEMKLPPLARPAPAAAPEGPASGLAVASDASAGMNTWDDDMPVAASAPIGYAAPVETPAARALTRELAAPLMFRPASDAAEPNPATEAVGPGSVGSAGVLAANLVPTATPATAATVLPARPFVLPKGALVDCTLETAIDSTLPGMTRCVVAVDVYGADGKVVLIERGSTLVGEVGTAVRAGQRRVFVLWNTLRTPTGVVASLASPGTDALGRAGVGGDVDNHFMERFGAALLLSVVDAATVALVNAQQSDGSTVVLSPQGSQEVVAEVVKSTVNVPPTIRVAQGARLRVFVARDVDFSGVYVLKTRTHTP